MKARRCQVRLMIPAGEGGFRVAPLCTANAYWFVRWESETPIQVCNHCKKRLDAAAIVRRATVHTWKITRDSIAAVEAAPPKHKPPPRDRVILIGIDEPERNPEDNPIYSKST